MEALKLVNTVEERLIAKRRKRKGEPASGGEVVRIESEMGVDDGSQIVFRRPAVSETLKAAIPGAR
jgi:hypothetical protein